jgi:outer membrane lipoprotein carrier protein
MTILDQSGFGRRVAAIALGLALGALVLPIRAATPQAPTASDLAARLQKRYESIRDFTADFEQTFQGLLVKHPTTERGKLLLKKPSRVRFSYEKPEKKEFVSDGLNFYSYYPADRAGTETPLPKGDDVSTALLFLAGRGNLTRDFTSKMAAGAPAGELHLGLVPKSKDADFETLTLFVDAQSLALLGFSTTDQQGTNTIRFLNLKENTGLSDRAFDFAFPKGTAISR